VEGGQENERGKESFFARQKRVLTRHLGFIGPGIIASVAYIVIAACLARDESLLADCVFDRTLETGRQISPRALSLATVTCSSSYSLGALLSSSKFSRHVSDA
jgi:hypothetical protein